MTQSILPSKIKSILRVKYSILLFLAPQMAFAATTPTTYSGLVSYIIGIIDLIIPALFAVLFVYFIWKMVDAWVINAGDERKRTEGKSYAISAVLMFVLMISAWGIVHLIKDSLF